MGNIYRERIERLRDLMRSRDWDAVLVTGGDPHSSEYPAERWKQVQWLSGFTGEAGDLVVTLEHAGLWTDTRYFIQAVQQLEGTGVELHKTRVPEQVLIPEWLESQFGEEGIIAVDGLCVSADFAKTLPCTVISVPDMLSIMWPDRPEIPHTPVFTVQAGETRASKIAWLRGFISENGCDGILVTALDEIAWLLNVRAADIEYNPLVISYLLVTDDCVEWYVAKDADGDPQTSATMSILESEGISILPYSETEQALQEFRGRLFVDPSTLNWSLCEALLNRDVDIVEGNSPVGLRKAVKNEFETKGMRDIHVKDGLAMEHFLYWLEKSVQGGKEITEWDASVALGRFRAEIPEYMGDSFETISAYGPSAALPHYVTPRTNAPVLREHGLFLCDSGGQYSCGTTDITRTVPLGECTRLEQEDYTLVLKGHIALAAAVFPAGTAGCQIDALAREPLWRSQRNFGHGTGHGVGYFLGVHEGPQDIRQNFNSTPLLPGMITSDEPGIYREGLHGVRHENLLLCVDAGSNEFGKWRSFETLTLCHFDTSAIIAGLLTEDERKWLNSYNERVYSVLGRLLPEEEREWLYSKTRPI